VTIFTLRAWAKDEEFNVRWLQEARGLKPDVRLRALGYGLINQVKYAKG
jgi:hypothetical protein